jgi:hypothetical protein
MAIKRLAIVELDDTPDTDSQTKVPDVLGVKTPPLRDRDATRLSPGTSDETDSPAAGAVPTKQIGRTAWDLVSEFFNEPRAMATILFFGAFALFVFGGEVKTFADLLVPLAVGVFLNAVWFLVPLVARTKRK